MPSFVSRDFQLLQVSQQFLSIPQSAIILRDPTIPTSRPFFRCAMLCRTSILYKSGSENQEFCVNFLIGSSTFLFFTKASSSYPGFPFPPLSSLLDPLLTGLVAKYANVLKCKRSPSFLWPVSQNELLTREDQSLVCFSLFQWSSTTSYFLL